MRRIRRFSMVVMAVTLFFGLVFLGTEGVRAAPGSAIKSFCEYGSAQSVQLGSGGGLWTQQWGQHPVKWFQCETSPNNGLLNKNVVGTLQSQTVGAPYISPSLMVTLPLAGTLTLTAYEDDAHTEVSGEIVASFQGDFLLDGFAGHATETSGKILIPFGRAASSDATPMYMEVVSATGKFKNVNQVDLWEFYVSGQITLARVPTLPLQVNILAALQNSALILGAEEETVLTGSYYRAVPK